MLHGSGGSFAGGFAPPCCLAQSRQSRRRIYGALVFQVREVLLGLADLVFPLYTCACTCSTKTISLSNFRFGPHIAMELDVADIGAHALVGTAPLLGLYLEGLHFLKEGKWKNEQAEKGAWRNSKATYKFG